MVKALVIGGTSGIAEQLMRLLAARSADLYITARDEGQFSGIAADLAVRGAMRVELESLDVTDPTQLEDIVARASETLGGLDAVLFAAGFLPDQAAANGSAALVHQVMQVNATGAMVAMQQAANFFEQQGHGQIVAIGSVAGDRGRATNYAYGAAKGALEIFLSGLRQRLHGSGVQVLLVKPGFVDTPMTATFDKGALWATPERVARDIVRAMDKGRSVIYTPWFWRWIMLVIKHIPGRIFDRLKF
jgi:decaprenylphospho-beta-D-erythro-pentofuranosid-2-ulose 2-reductase